MPTLRRLRMEFKQVLYKDIDDALDKYDYEEDMDVDIIPIENDIILLSSPIWCVTDKNLCFVEGVYCNRNDTEGFDPDWSATVIYEGTGEPDLSKYAYFEQGTPAVAIHNYLTMKNQNN